MDLASGSCFSLCYGVVMTGVFASPFSLLHSARWASRNQIEINKKMLCGVVCIVGMLLAFACWQLERRSALMSGAMQREAATAWGLDPEQFKPSGRRKLSNQPTVGVWARQTPLALEEIHVTEEEGLVCLTRKSAESEVWENKGCIVVSSRSTAEKN